MDGKGVMFVRLFVRHTCLSVCQCDITVCSYTYVCLFHFTCVPMYDVKLTISIAIRE